MKKYILLSLIIFSASSCCKYIACEENHYVSVAFYGFTPAELDTIYTTGYAAGSYFTTVSREQKTDTIGPPEQSADNYFLLVLKEPMTTNTYMRNPSLYDTHEWKIYIPSVNKTILISNYGYKTYKCSGSHGCGSRRKEPVHTLSTCSVNGAITKVDDIKIYK